MKQKLNRLYFSISRQYTTCSVHARATDQQTVQKRERKTYLQEWMKIMTVNLPRRNFWKVAFKTKSFQKCWPLNSRVLFRDRLLIVHCCQKTFVKYQPTEQQRWKQFQIHLSFIRNVFVVELYIHIQMHVFVRARTHAYTHKYTDTRVRADTLQHYNG